MLLVLIIILLIIQVSLSFLIFLYLIQKDHVYIQYIKSKLPHSKITLIQDKEEVEITFHKSLLLNPKTKKQKADEDYLKTLPIHIQEQIKQERKENDKLL